MSPQTGSRPRPGSRRPAQAPPVREPCTLTCPTRQTLDRLADRWSVVLLEHLETGAKRFGQLRDSTAGISEKVLTQTLRSLERDGLIARRVHPGAVPQVEYRLTMLGRSLLNPLAMVRSWAQRHISEIERARLDYDEADTAATPGYRADPSFDRDNGCKGTLGNARGRAETGAGRELTSLWWLASGWYWRSGSRRG